MSGPESVQRNYADISEVSDFIQEAERRFESVVHGEKDVTENAAVLMTTRYPVVMGGPGGSGKTTLLKEIVKGIEGNNGDSLAIVPGLSDVTPSQLIGARVVTESYDADNNLTEKQIKAVPGIITPKTLFVRADEFPKLAKRAREALLPVLEERIIRSTEGEVRLDNLLGFWATQNAARPQDRLETIDARRFAAGLIFYDQDDSIKEEMSLQNAEGTPSEGSQEDPFITVEQFKAVQNTVLYNRDSKDKAVIVYGDEEKKRAYEYQKAIQAVVQQLTRGETESLTAMSGQMGRIARAVAIKEKAERISDKHLLKAAKLVAASRVIMLQTNGKPGETLREVHDTLEQL